MANKLEQFIPVVQSDGLNSDKNGALGGNLTFSGVNTYSGNSTYTGNNTFSGSTTISGSATIANVAGPILVGTSGTGTDVGGSVTVNAQRGVITTASLSTIAGTTYILTLKDTFIGATSQVFASVYSGSNTGGNATIGAVTPFAGSATIVVSNAGTAAVFNGTLKVNFFVAS